MADNVVSPDIISSVVEEDSRAEVRLNNGVIIYDLVYAGPKSVGAYIARRFLLEMAAFPDLGSYTEVDLAYHGEVRYRIYVGDLRKLSDGYRLGEMAAFHRLLRLPSVMQSLEGKYAFPKYDQSSLQHMRYMSEDLNKMLEHWYLGALLSEHSIVQP